jgi:acyl-CoA:acyl-CoA alkyltransferase
MSGATCSRIVDVAVHLPSEGLSTSAVEERIAAANPGLEIPRGAIQEISGVAYRHIAPEGWMPSDLAVVAARKLLAAVGYGAHQLDLIIFAAVGGDMLEPATAHIVADKLEAKCPVFDLKNACNAVMNAIEVADALIRAGTYRRVLIAYGEMPSRVLRWRFRDTEEFLEHGAVFVASDAGAALLLERSPEPGVLRHWFSAKSDAWPLMTIPYVELDDGRQMLGIPQVEPLKLLAALDAIDTGPLFPIDLTGSNPACGRWDEVAVVCVQQATLQSFEMFCSRLGIPAEKLVPTIVDHGNLQAATLPVQLAQAVETGRVQRGGIVVLVGVASGLSYGFVVLKW